MRQGDDSRKGLEGFVKASILNMLLQRQVDACQGHETNASDLKLNKTAVAFYGLNDGNALEGIVEKLKKEISEGIDRIVSNSRAEGNIVREMYGSVDEVLRDSPCIVRDGTRLRVEGRFGHYEVDLFTGDITAMCKGGHRSVQSICLVPRKETSVGLDDISLESAKTAVAVAINLARDEEIIGEIRASRRFAECPYCVLEGRLSKDDVDVIENQIAKNTKGDENRRGRWLVGTLLDFSTGRRIRYSDVMLDGISQRLYEEWQNRCER